LGCKHRPAAILFWTARQRILAKPPIGEVKKDLTGFGDAWRAWYTGLMPEWRTSSSSPGRWPLLRNPPPGEPWSEVRKGERNGVLLLILSLSWW
ncbi:hypothetical protein SCHPADRAFT_791541, partial [Schizopora paradoxa]